MYMYFTEYTEKERGVTTTEKDNSKFTNRNSVVGEVI